MAEFSKGDKVEFTDMPIFQFGDKKTFQTGTVIGVIGSARNGMSVVAVKLEQTSLGAVDPKPRVEFVIDGEPTSTNMRKVEVEPDGGEG